MKNFAFWYRRWEQVAPRVYSRGGLRHQPAQPTARVGISLAMLLGILILFVPPFSAHRPDGLNLNEKLVAPSLDHPLGTDQYGRDQLMRLADGGRRSLGAALLVLSSTLFLSLCVGIAVGVTGGIVDTIIMRVVDVRLALPPLIFALALVGMFGVGFENLMLALMLST